MELNNTQIPINYIFEAIQIEQNHRNPIYNKTFSWETILSTNLTVFWNAIIQCLNLNDLIQSSSHSSFNLDLPQILGQNLSVLQSLDRWCLYGRHKWYALAVLSILGHSWPVQFTDLLRIYVSPMILVLSLLSLLLCIPSLCRIFFLIKKQSSNVIPDFYSNQQRRFLPATWIFLFWYSLLGSLWLCLSLTDYLLNQYFRSIINPSTSNFGCRMITYMQNVLNYTPTWLVAVMVCDRALGEYRRSDRHQHDRFHHQSYRNHDSISKHSNPSCSKTDHRQYDSDQDPKSTENLMNPCIEPWHETNNWALFLTKPDYLHTKSMWFKSTKFKCVFHSPNQTKWSSIIKQFGKPISNYKSGKIHSNQPGWAPVGMSHVGGSMLTGIVISLICLINVHMLWLYKVNRSTQRCTLVAGDSIMLTAFYPIFLQICHTIIPQIFTILGSCFLIGLYFKRRSAQRLDRLLRQSHCIRHPQPLLSQPTQLVLLIGFLHWLFQIGETGEWLHARFDSTGSFSLPSDNADYLNNTISSTETPNLQDFLRSNAILAKTISDMQASHVISKSFLLWSKLRFLPLLPILIGQSQYFRDSSRLILNKIWHMLICPRLIRSGRESRSSVGLLNSGHEHKSSRKDKVVGCATTSYCCVCMFNSSDSMKFYDFEESHRIVPPMTNTS